MSYELLGLIEYKNTFYNFVPYYEVRGTKLYELTEYDISVILPDTERSNINLYCAYKDTDAEEYLAELYNTNFPVILSFEENDLEDNLNRDGNVNPTAYKISAKNIYEQNKIKQIHEKGFYYVIPLGKIATDLGKAELVELDDDYLQDGQEIMIDMEDGTYIGPYTVRMREVDHQMLINTNMKKNKYVLSGYKSENVKVSKIRNNFYDYNNYVIAVNIIDKDKVEYKDVISEKDLMEMFFKYLKNSPIVDGKINADNLDGLIDGFEESLTSGTYVSDTIRNRRLNLINNCITGELSSDDAMKSMVELISENGIALLERYKDTDEVRAFIDKIVKSSPELLESAKYTQTAKNQLDEIERKREELLKEIEELKEEKENTSICAVDSVEIFSSEQNDALKGEIEELTKQLDEYKGIENLTKSLENLKKEAEYEEWHKRQLEDSTKELERKIVSGLDEINKKLYDTAIDGFLANKIAEASSEWAQKKSKENYISVINKLQDVYTEECSSDALIDYLCHNIQKLRPNYDRNTIINLAICFTQGFLTVLSGKPGCGKTSICNIFSEVLGLKSISRVIKPVDGISPNRFVSVSVERGWTSKRDLVGYFNPLTKTFDKSNRQIYDALQILSLEKELDAIKYPMYVLLDEANLSPMEYYWADFMSLCDDLDENSVVNLGGDNVFSVTDNFRFMATINNDHTTENLSPRLVDRAWVITLPRSAYNTEEGQLDKNDIKLVSWNALDKTFNKKGYENKQNTEIKQRFDKVVKFFEEINIHISPRTYGAIKKYCNTGVELFKTDTAGRSPEIIALDYAISQKMLPKISGYGTEYAERLKKLQMHCENEAYMQSSHILKEIIARGDMQMNYYQFFN